MSKWISFIGPTLSWREARRFGCEVRPPARQGDVWRALLGKPRALVLIDGVFESQPSVWHHELRAALASGIAVFGASSMGALRAAELQSEGMIGVGEIFRDYRDGKRIDECRRALLHADAEHDFRPLTVPLVTSSTPRANSSARRRHVGSSKKRAPRITRGGSGQEICSPRISKRKTRASVSKRRARGSSRKRRRRLRGRSPNRHTCGGDDCRRHARCAGEIAARARCRGARRRGKRAGACWQFGRGGWAWFPSRARGAGVEKKFPRRELPKISGCGWRKTSRSSSRCSPRRSAGCTNGPSRVEGLAEEAMLRGRWQKPPSPEGGEGQGEVPTRAQNNRPVPHRCSSGGAHRVRRALIFSPSTRRAWHWSERWRASRRFPRTPARASSPARHRWHRRAASRHWSRRGIRPRASRHRGARRVALGRRALRNRLEEQRIDQREHHARHDVHVAT